ncbi:MULTISPECIES: P-loop NTPase fold protein [Halomonadaceae]|uniref:NTPase KAP n=2 Tax=Vreelandella TaxID=3137766 RepID=A0A7Z0LR48_9GAMM|nr:MULTISPECIES: P-loop NTPase fold protein [Halomonas]NYS76948.1 NTPase KAP [Halomonas glaciei]|tara:strand:- start:142 stop:2349 length:2208 start_codon:yes stop_codon:yes gene_type:complete
MTTQLDSDRALENETKDKFGFAGMAERLAPSLVEASKGDGIVIGLEGKWGSGKTSLLNFLRHELVAAQDEEIYTITIAPWLNGDTSSLVASLLEPMSGILNKKEYEIAQAHSGQARETRERMAEVSQLLRNYGPKTARRAASIANVVGYLVPGAQLVGGALEAGANAAEQVLPTEKTPSELKQEIGQKIRDLDIGFVVILDDLDRLEPAQAVEVVRLVRSVADFPRVAYLMCYDREVLAQALKTGLKIDDGDLFLQKIVQLTFSIPLPEPFDLRTQFLEEAQLIYEEVMGNKIAGELLVDLKTAVDRQGSKLSTPREVKLALNGIRFVFPQIKDDVYFPDFCRLHLIKTTHYKLYQWLESYLSVRSVLVTGDATVASDERAEMGKVLKKLLPSEGVGSAQSIWSLQRFVPGVSNQKKPEESVFNRAGTMSVSKTISLKRLGSPLHYRFYFALTGPKTVMSDNDFNSLLELARSDVEKLVSRLSEEVEKRRGSGKTWFEHVLDRLDDGCISNLDEKQLEGFLLAFADMMDTAISVGNNQDFFFVTVDQAADSAAQCCLSRLQVLNPDKQAETVRKIASDGKAINWLVGYFFRNQLFRHGKVGDKAEHPDQWEISEKVLDQAIEILRERVRQPDIKEIIPSLPDVSAYLYGWINISENDDAVAWVQKYCESDEGFLKILDHLRGWAMSDRVYYPLSAESVSRFLDWNETTMRLKQLKDGEFSEKVAELEMAIKQSRH